jgi:hypothetical protein
MFSVPIWRNIFEHLIIRVNESASKNDKVLMSNSNGMVWRKFLPLATLRFLTAFLITGAVAEEVPATGEAAGRG